MERRLPDEHLVHENAEAPEVDRLVVELTLDYLRRNVILNSQLGCHSRAVPYGGSAERGRHAILAVHFRLAHAEIGQVHVAIAVE